MPTNISKPVKRRFLLTISYDGTNYSGWQFQSGVPTIQESLETTLGIIVRHPCTVHGSGRTDKGVHAMGQVAHVDLTTRMTPRQIRRALNTRLPEDIRIVGGRVVHDRFHARISAVSKEYRYFILNDEIMPPHKRLYALHEPRPLDVDLMREAAARFVGEHDFVAFMANPHRVLETTVRRVTHFEVRHVGKRIELRVRGSGFLYKQVRSMVGLLIRIGLQAEKPEFISELLTHKSPRTARVPSAQPQGLYLWHVWF